MRDEPVLNKQIVIVGLGVTGLSVVRYFQRTFPSYSLKVIDTRANPPGLAQLPSSIERTIGHWNSEWLYEADQIIVNPGLPLTTPELQEAIARGVEVIGDIELFARELNRSHPPIPVVGITGSNGKSTVTDLLGEIAREAGIDVGVGGNIGTPALDLLANSPALYVLELSSYQLETTHSLNLTVALFLNIAEDHMDRYQVIQNYATAKQRIFAHAKFAVVNAHEAITFPVEKGIPTADFGIAGQSVSPQSHASQHHYRLTSMGKTPSEKSALPWLTIDETPIIESDAIALMGTHHRLNCLAVLATVDQLTPLFPSLSRAVATALFRRYNGLNHRCQTVKNELPHGLRWINDSKATNVASTLAALSGLQIKGTLHLFVGGDSKRADLTPLATVFETLPLQLYCYGADRARFVEIYPRAQICETLEEAVMLALQEAKPNDTLLLSPACASLDQFKNFEQRGDLFCRLASTY